MRYNVFIRSWWKDNFSGNWPNDLEPCPGEKTYIVTGLLFHQARMVASQYNNTHDPGRYSIKAEIEEA